MAVGLALLRLERAIRAVARRFGLTLEDLKLVWVRWAAGVQPPTRPLSNCSSSCLAFSLFTSSP
jgi:hypothetical protein